MSVFEFKLPDVGEGLSEGEIVRWLVAVGETVAVDQLLVEVQTDKAVVEIPSPVAGTLVKQGGQPNDILPIGAVLASIEVADEQPSTSAKPASIEAASPAASALDLAVADISSMAAEVSSRAAACCSALAAR